MTTLLSSRVARRQARARLLKLSIVAIPVLLAVELWAGLAIIQAIANAS